VYSDDLVEKLAEALSMLGLRRAMVVHGSDGLDEITVSGATRVVQRVICVGYNLRFHPALEAIRTFLPEAFARLPSLVGALTAEVGAKPHHHAPDSPGEAVEGLMERSRLSLEVMGETIAAAGMRQVPGDKPVPALATAPERFGIAGSL
jgi:hypothetical protein